jgi:hypothetical protein
MVKFSELKIYLDLCISDIDRFNAFHHNPELKQMVEDVMNKKIDQENIDELLNYIRYYADQNNPIGLYLLGSVYYHECGVPKNVNLAFEYCLRAAELGVTHAQFNIGMMYHLGIYVEKNLVMALKYYVLSGLEMSNKQIKSIIDSDPKIIHELINLINNLEKRNKELEDPQFIL